MTVIDSFRRLSLCMCVRECARVHIFFANTVNACFRPSAIMREEGGRRRNVGIFDTMQHP
jgi:hypothetical protein